MNPPVDQVELVKRAVARDPAAWGKLYDLYSDVVYRVAYRMVASQSDAEDAVQDVFIGLPSALSTFENRGSLEGWMKRVTVRTVLMKLRKQRAREGHFRRYAPTWFKWATKPSIHDRLSIEAALAALPESQRIVFVLRTEGYSHEEIGQMLGLSLSITKMRFHRACRRLRPLLRGQ